MKSILPHFDPGSRLEGFDDLLEGLSDIATVSVFLHELGHIFRYTDRKAMERYAELPAYDPFEEMTADLFAYIGMRLLGFECSERLLSALASRDRMRLSPDSFRRAVRDVSKAVYRHARDIRSPKKLIARLFQKDTKILK